jgi:hypothetical protein
MSQPFILMESSHCALARDLNTYYSVDYHTFRVDTDDPA